MSTNDLHPAGAELETGRQRLQAFLDLAAWLRSAPAIRTDDGPLGEYPQAGGGGGSGPEPGEVNRDPSASHVCSQKTNL